MRLLVGPRQHRERGEADELAVEGDVLLLPDAQDDVQRFRKLGARRLQRGIPDLVLPTQEPGPYPEVEAALAEHVERGVVLGQPQRVMVGEQRHGGADAEPTGTRGDGDSYPRRIGEHAAEAVEVVLGQPYAGKAQLLGQYRIVDDLAQQARRRGSETAGIGR